VIDLTLNIHNFEEYQGLGSTFLGYVLLQNRHGHLDRNHLAPEEKSNLIQIRSATFQSGRAASEGALAPEPPRATRFTPEYIRNFPPYLLFIYFFDFSLWRGG